MLKVHGRDLNINYQEGNIEIVSNFHPETMIELIEKLNADIIDKEHKYIITQMSTEGLIRLKKLIETELEGRDDV